MRPSRVGKACLALIVVLGLGGCTGARSGAPPTSAPVGTQAPPTPSSSPTTVPSTPSTPSTPTMPSTPAAPSASALGDLAPFVDAARELDGRLRAAAPLVSSGIRSDVVVVDGRTAAAVRALSISRVASTVPAGLPPELMRRVLTVYSDLVSRTQSMSAFRYADRTYSRTTVEGEPGLAWGEEMVACLANGTVAAQRFTADLGAVTAAARSTSPLPSLAPASLARAELQVRLQEIMLRNSGCGSCGGHVATSLSTIVWDDAAPAATTRTGRIVAGASTGTGAGDGPGIPVIATYAPGTGWTVELRAC